MQENPKTRQKERAFWQDSARRRWLVRRGLPLLLLALGAGGLLYYWRLIAPYRVARQYVRAVEERDLDTLYALTDPREYQQVPLTQQGLEQAFAAMFETPVLCEDLLPESPYQRRTPDGIQHEFSAYWLDRNTHQRLPGKWKRKRPQAWSFLKVRPTPAGWRVATTTFLSSTSLGRWGSSERFKAVAWKAGIRYLLSDVPGRPIEPLFKQAGVGSQAQP